jgi:membrane-associated PAP2 superfamily phosphatase
MSRRGLLVALAIAAVVGIVFGLYPQLDILLERPFFNPSLDPTGMGFWARLDPTFNGLRDLARLIVTVSVAPAVIALLAKIAWPRRSMLIPGRAALLLVSTLALGPGVVTNLVLKNHWGRPRPIDVVAFGGNEHFVAWWDPRGDCPDNCSFVAGEPSGAFWMLAPAALTPPAWRPVAYTAAIAFGAGIGILRMVAGGHFFSDVVFAGVFTFLLIWIVHGCLYRWWGDCVTDRGIERWLERLTLSLRGAPPRIVPPGAATAPPATANEPIRQAHEGE